MDLLHVNGLQIKFLVALGAMPKYTSYNAGQLTIMTKILVYTDLFEGISFILCNIYNI